MSPETETLGRINFWTPEQSGSLLRSGVSVEIGKGVGDCGEGRGVMSGRGDNPERECSRVPGMASFLPWSIPVPLNTNTVFFLNVYLFILREGGGAEKEGERENSKQGSAPSTWSPMWRSNPQTVRS